MAIQPIDLQTLFSQLDKVARAQLAQREGLAIQQAVQGVQIQRKADEQAKTVHEVQNTGDDGAEKVNDKGRKGHNDGKGEKKNSQQEASNLQKQASSSVFRDPVLGKNVDINF
ncbi:MAG: hypothetical protein FWB78_05110 [Treponema sp.]|nr:hypothetical protein [Treponema sp.]